MAIRSLTRQELEAAARDLPRDERARLAEALLASLEEDAAIEQAWRDEIRRRLAELEAGAVEGVTGEDVFAELDGITAE